MSTTTANLGLIKPERSDNYSVDVMSTNMDVIDAKIGTLEGKVSTIESEVNGDLVCNSVTVGNLNLNDNCILVPFNTTTGIKFVDFSKTFSTTNKTSYSTYTYTVTSPSLFQPNGAFPINIKFSNSTTALSVGSATEVLLNNTSVYTNSSIGEAVTKTFNASCGDVFTIKLKAGQGMTSVSTISISATISCVLYM